MRLPRIIMWSDLMQTTSLVTNDSKIIRQTKRPRQSAVVLYEGDGKLNSGVRSPNPEVLTGAVETDSV